MIEYLKEYFISEKELISLKDSLEEISQRKLKDNDRLRTALQLYIVLECCCDSITEELTEDFVNNLKKDIEQAKERSGEILKTQAVETRDKLMHLINDVQEIRNELSIRGKCISDIEEGLSTTEAINGEAENLKIIISENMNKLEKLLASYIKLRDGRSFSDLCALINES